MSNLGTVDYEHAIIRTTLLSVQSHIKDHWEDGGVKILEQEDDTTYLRCVHSKSSEGSMFDMSYISELLELDYTETSLKVIRHLVNKKIEELGLNKENNNG